MLLKIVSFLSLFLLKRQHTKFLNSFLNSKSNLQYIIIFMLEFRMWNASVKEFKKKNFLVLGEKIRILLIIALQQKNRPTTAKIFLLSACSTFLETCLSVSSSIWLLVCLTFYGKKNMLGETDWILEELKLSPFEFLLTYEGIVWAPWRRMVVHKWPSLRNRSPSMLAIQWQCLET